MGKKVRLVMFGQCPNCGAEFVRKSPCDTAVCDCQNPNPTVIPLSPVLLLPAFIYKHYAKIAELAEVSVERLVNAVLEEGAKKKLRKLQSHPEIMVTTKER
jgi:hypothetical protein